VDTCADVNMRDESFGWAPILFAARAGDTKLSALLLDAKADVHAGCCGANTALHLTARGGHAQASSLLLARGAELEARNAHGWTPFAWSCIVGCLDVAQLLLAAGAEVATQDCDGRTACMWAARHGHIDIVRAILPMGIDLSVIDNSGLSAKEHAIHYENMQKAVPRGKARKPKLSHASDDYSALYGSNELSSVDLQRLLTQHRATVEPANPALAEEVTCDRRPGELVDVIVRALDASEHLLDLAKNNFWDCLEETLKIGACANTLTPADRRSPLMWAAIHDAPAAAMLLVSARAELELRDVLGWTALHHAVYVGSALTVSVLHHLGANFSAKSDSGDLVQHLAARADMGWMLQLIHATVPDLDILDADGCTPLQSSATGGRVSSLRTLLALRADVSVKDPQERSVFALGVVHGRGRIVKAMLEPAVALPRLWEEDDLSQILQRLPWVAAGKIRRRSNARCLGSESPHLRGKNAHGAKHAARVTSMSNRARHQRPTLGSINEVDSVADSVASSPQGACSSDSESSVHSKESACSHASNGSLASIASLASTASRASNRSCISTRSSNGTQSKSSARSTRARNMAKTKKTASSKREDATANTPISLMLAASNLGTQASDADVPILVAKDILSVRDSAGSEPLALAARYGHPDLVCMLLKMRAQVDSTDAYGNTALMLATSHGACLAVTTLLEARARVDVRNLDGQRAIELAKSSGLQRLLQAQADRETVEHKIVKSCSLPALVNNGGRTSKSATAFKYRVRVDGLPSRQRGEHLEEFIFDILEDFDIDRPARVDVAVDPLTMRPCGHAYVDFLNARQAKFAESTLRTESSLLVSLVA